MTSIADPSLEDHDNWGVANDAALEPLEELDESLPERMKFDDQALGIATRNTPYIAR